MDPRFGLDGQDTTGRLAPPSPIGPVRSLTIDLTHDCPFHCRGCIEAAAMAGSMRRELRLETACEIISRFVEGGGHEVLYYGGESTSHPQFDEVVMHAAKAAVPRLQVVTNGAGLKAGTRTIAALNAAALEVDVGVRVSLNAGTAATHEALHGASGYFKTIVSGLKALTSGGSRVRLGISFLAEDANAHELEQAYAIASLVGAVELFVRPKTRVHGQGVLPLGASARAALAEAIERLREADSPRLMVEPWYEKYLRSGRHPDTTKEYPVCRACQGRVVVTPPDPGIAWLCTYWRGDSRFLVADLANVPFGSPAFDERRVAAIRAIDPTVECAGVICNQHRANTVWWDAISRQCA